MILTLDTDAATLTIRDDGAAHTIPLYSDEAFAVLSRQWVRIGWNQKHAYTFSWFGRPVIQLPEDLVRAQEAIYALRPDVILETGVAHGGSLAFYASLLKAMDRGRVIGIDIEIREHNRRAIEAHPLASRIALVDGDSVAPATLARIRSMIAPGETVMVVLDSNHSRDHVLAECEAYAPFVTPGSYLVVTDGIMEDLHDTPRGKAGWRRDNPLEAIRTFLDRNPQFKRESHQRPFNDSSLDVEVTHWPGAWLRRSAT